MFTTALVKLVLIAASGTHKMLIYVQSTEFHILIFGLTEIAGVDIDGA